MCVKTRTGNKKRKGDAEDCMSGCLIEALTRCLTKPNNYKNGKLDERVIFANTK